MPVVHDHRHRQPEPRDGGWPGRRDRRRAPGDPDEVDQPHGLQVRRVPWGFTRNAGKNH